MSNRHIGIDKFIRYSGFVLVFMVQMCAVSYSQLPWKDQYRIHEKSFSEELYIRTDRDLYAAGEKVWFKVYKINSLTLSPVNMGKVAYVDILDLENNPVAQLKIEIDGFSGSGDFILPDTLRTGNYIMRSYTNWMQNFSKDLFAYRSISVINPFDKLSNFKIPWSAQNPDSVVFYPEGGHLVAGLETKLGFRISDRNGNPVRMNGILINDKNDTLCRVQTGNNGYDIVSVIPSGLNKLFLVSSDKNKQRKFPLPDVQQEGVILSSVQKSDKSKAIAKLNFSSNYSSNGKNIYLEIYSSGLSGSRKTIIPGTEQALSISANDVPYGISHLVVSDEHGKKLTDRWILKEGNNVINYKINLPESGLVTRNKIKIDISATDNRGNPVESEFSVSVVKSVTANRENICSAHCWQLPGMAPVIEDCNLKDINDFLVFYNPHDSVSNQVGDSDNFGQLHLPELEGHLISGIIRERVSGEPLRNESITLSFVGKRAQCLFTRTDSSGNFNFVTKEHGLKEIVIQPLTFLKDCYVDLNNPFPSGYNDYDHGVFCLDTSKLENINNAIISMQINNIYEPFFIL